ncbi:MAG: bacteriohemerythrin [Candidatus Competibacteraceae bacterium]
MTVSSTTDDYSVDSAALNSEHEVQVELINALRQAVEQGQKGAVVDEILDQLIAYTNAHFMSEQLLMRLYAYPFYESHTQEHDRLIEQVQNLQEHYRAGDMTMTLQASSALREWLLDHIKGLDHGLGMYLSQQGVMQLS